MPTGVYKRPDPEARFRAKVQVDEATGCHVWTAASNNFGYGVFKIMSRNIGAHRFAYELVHGSIPEGLELDHLCRNHACVRVDHLQAVTHRENVLATGALSPPAHQSRQTHCKRGHELAGGNLVREGEKRRCRTCANARRRKKAAA
jgi:hypothetical protein